MAIKIWGNSILLGNNGIAAADACCCVTGCPATESECTDCGDRTVTVSGWTGDCSRGNGSYTVSPTWNAPEESCVYYGNDVVESGVDACGGMAWSSDYIDITIYCEDGLWYVQIYGSSWTPDCDVDFDWTSEGRAGDCPPTGAYNMVTDGLADSGGSDCPAPTVSLS